MARSAPPSDKALTRAVHRVFLGVVVICCLVLFVLWRTDNPRIERLRMSLIDTAMPSMTWISEPMDFAWHVARDYENFLNVYEQNKALRREIQALRAWREAARLLEEENAQLRALNNVRLARRISFVTGDVFADSGGPFRHAALVNVGRRDEIKDGAAAMDGAGLVGRVVGVGERASRLLLLTDYSSRVPVIVQPGARRAVLVGDGSGQPRLDFLEEIEQVEPGDLIETSGDGGVFPPDLPVGNVVISPNGTRRANLFADYGQLEFVRLLRYEPDTEIDQPGGLVRPDGGSTDKEEPNLAGGPETSE